MNSFELEELQVLESTAVNRDNQITPGAEYEFKLGPDIFLASGKGLEDLGQAAKGDDLEDTNNITL